MSNGDLMDDSDHAAKTSEPAVAAQGVSTDRRDILLKCAKWSSPAMITLLLTDKASAASNQNTPPPPGFK